MLSTKHREMLEVESGITPAVIHARGYNTVTKRSELHRLGFGADQRRVPTLLIPLHHVKGGKPRVHQHRPDEPRKNSRGKLLKYEYPFGKCPVLDCPPVELMYDTLNTKGATIYVTEGSKKADSAVSHGVPCLSLAGVYNWRGVNSHGVKVTISDFDEIDWEGREVRICFDNDVMTKEEVYYALARLAGILERRGAKVKFCILPSGPLKGLDDFLVSGETSAALDRLTVDRIPDAPAIHYTYNDLGMANRVVDFFNSELVYDNHNKAWYVWGEGRWVQDRPGNFAKAFILDYTDCVRQEAFGLRPWKEDDEKKSPRDLHLAHASAYGNSIKVQGAEQIMRARLAEADTCFDRKPNLLNCSNGTLDLETMEFFDPRPTDRLTVRTNVRWPESEAEAQCPMWQGFMEERFPNVETREFIQRMCGLFVTGNSPEKAFFIIRGEPDCGKTVFVEYLHWLLGGYGNKVDKHTLTKTRNDTKQQEKAVELVGKRYVYVDESSSHDKLDETFIKEVTGGDTTLKFRRLFEQVNEVKAEFTIVLATNYKPQVTGSDAALWRRCHLVEFGRAIPLGEQIGNFKDLLKAEGPGVLRWCVDGYRMWKDGGLVIPGEVAGWTQTYQEENDPLGRFIKECYTIGEDIEDHMMVSDFHLHYTAWCLESDVTVKTLADSAALSRAVRARWPLLSDGPKGGGRGRRLFHLRAKREFRSTEGVKED